MIVDDVDNVKCPNCGSKDIEWELETDPDGLGYYGTCYGSDCNVLLMATPRSYSVDVLDES